ncbi:MULTISPECIES: 2-amino-4-hydroxy-6-hydroxymethyldihydropteridine diphosphokinase [unclassified Kaistella]|uniref:2-amino-4-hydroxy-6- hydroxymethyldihydropteridine diphosphokinase n=1 Tax=unclassified Kaistella TaxID=2762626 RepID=UPI00273448AC|nr:MULTISPECIES: 2-amino-4-hydroxy-6-hydroxymethyldihydropteridine diphosphokinase [unclassified Kaistella]MCZ2083229.1 2-amino-4-hydroxy-6-hydroxymethyldihydropteridine diphosphokinase [Flavobacteriales bacterium]MDP2454228.1 2-amino-4-hydroxy-6-hydroxymethyldihydropteridine diphosphokinase [Kaistella sp. SH11-4b]MDP2457701.1 2-amino-4-hydroxy-6-hydroxymethyldihydropteridine diphosphokinase [Kaistella sp. SH40-3]MDP2460459.1 2-amino-4-hydroxy-6-hydroxymethyldihydropteridine diphosphokinase [Ka
MSQHDVTLLLGSNLGDPKKNIELALAIIEKEIGVILKRTEMLLTDPVEFVSNNIFCNIAIVIKTQFSPISLLNRIKLIEREMGRGDDTLIAGEYQDRIIDIDIVLFGNLHFCCKELAIPHHKHFYQRDFSRKLLNVL